MEDKLKWFWEQPDPNRANAAGDVAKLFKNQPIKTPGVFSIEPPTSDASLLAREVVQNAWDSAREYREKFDDPDAEFKITFDFQEHKGAERQQLIDSLGLRELSDRAGDERVRRRRMGLGTEDALTKLDTGAPLRTLTISEEGTTGLEGPWRGSESKMFLALLSVGFTQKSDGSGGSYGYGKAALIRGSETRTVIAYSSFAERKDDPGVDRRLLGVTYWGSHEQNEQNFTGFGRLGSVFANTTVEPTVNDQADRRAASMGMAARESASPGTTFLLLDPSVSPEDLLRAIEQNWWPAIMSRHLQFTAEVNDYDGNTLIPRPRKHPVLRPFIRAFDIASGTQDSIGSHERFFEFRKFEGLTPGRLGLVADLEGWSYADELEAMDPSLRKTEKGHRSLVALIRGPRMVVEYFAAAKAAPYVRGAFIADEAVDDLLRQTEPQAHDSWQMKSESGGVDSRSPELATSIINRIKTNVRDMTKELRPPPPPPDDVKLTVLDDLVKNLLRGSGKARPPGPTAEKRYISIQIVEQKLEVASSGDLRLIARVRFQLSEHIDDAEREADIAIFYRFIEDGRPGEICGLQSVHVPPGFRTDEDGIISGLLGHEPVDVTLTTNEYSSDWTGKLIVQASLGKGARANGN